MAPVCAKKNGPDDDRGRPQGIIKGTHYIRKAGPVSAPIESPDEWQDVIRRCVLSDKASLLGALSTMIEQPRPVPEAEEQSVFEPMSRDDLHEALVARGVIIHGGNPAVVLQTMLWRMGQEITHIKSFGYWPKDMPCAVSGYRPLPPLTDDDPIVKDLLA